MSTEKKAEPFRVTGPGRYRTRNDTEVNITRRHGTSGHIWYGEYLDDASWWGPEGEWQIGEPNHYLDIISRVDDEPAEMAGIGFTEIEPRGEVIYGLQHWYRDRTYLGNGTYVDWSKVPASAIVKPEPKIETRKVWLVMKDDGWMEASKFPPLGIACNAIAIVEREITFTHGEGLGSDP